MKRQLGPNQRRAGAVFQHPQSTPPTTVGAAVNGRICPRCELLVGTKADGTLRAHRIGSAGNRWACPGEDLGTL